MFPPITFGAHLERTPKYLEVYGAKQSQEAIETFRQKMPQLDNFENMTLVLSTYDHRRISFEAPIANDHVTLWMHPEPGNRKADIHKVIPRKVSLKPWGKRQEDFTQFVERVIRESKRWGEFYGIQ